MDDRSVPADLSRTKILLIRELLCDRTAARLAGLPSDGFVAMEDGQTGTMAGLKRSGIFDAVLKEIGDRVHRLAERQSQRPSA